MNSEEGETLANPSYGGGSDTELKQRYIDCCRRHGVLPNRALCSAFFKVDNKKVQQQFCRLVVFLDDLEDEDFLPLFDIFIEIDASKIDAVDIYHDSACSMDAKYILLLLRAITLKLRTVSLQDVSFGKEFLRDVSQRGLTCQTLNMRHSHFRKLNLSGTFMQLCTLNLDFSSSLSSFQEGCFTCMPNLRSLSLCETRIVNLWTTSSALSKLPSLVELRFQNLCFCCEDTGPCPAASGGKSSNSGHVISGIQEEDRSFQDGSDQLSELEVAEPDDDDAQRMSEDSSEYSEMDFVNRHRESGLLEELSYAIPGWHEYVDLQDEISGRALTALDEEEFSSSSWKFGGIPSDLPDKYISCHPSLICYERHYRDYMIASLPGLRVLDNLPIRKIDRDRAKVSFAENFEYLPYRRKNKTSVASILQKREISARYSGSKSRRGNQLHAPVKSQCFYSRELSAARVGSSGWPLLHPLSILGSTSGEESRDFRPRQFEYHPSDPSLMAFGTLDGELVVINHENENIVKYIPSLGAMNSVLGLCWLKKYPSKIIAGSDNGALRLYDIKHVSSNHRGNHSRSSVAFDEFDQLTSVHVNSTDELFLASGYSKNVALYDIVCGKRLQVFADMHEEHINVVKFANHSPSIFATSSFDKDVKMWDLRQKPCFPCYTASSSRGNVMVCFSPDDNYLLVSAVDNEVKQLLAADGRLHLDFNIGPTGSAQNYTRSYYLNGRDYIISGSCDEHVVRIFCAQTGRRLRDLSLEVKGTGASMFVQSLRGDPFRDFNMSILAANIIPSSNSRIVKVNMLAASDSAKDAVDQFSHPHSIMGG